MERKITGNAKIALFRGEDIFCFCLVKFVAAKVTTNHFSLFITSCDYTELAEDQWLRIHRKEWT